MEYDELTGEWKNTGQRFGQAASRFNDTFRVDSGGGFKASGVLGAIGNGLWSIVRFIVLGIWAVVVFIAESAWIIIKSIFSFIFAMAVGLLGLAIEILIYIAAFAFIIWLISLIFS